jgi:hypothetical protein
MSSLACLCDILEQILRLFVLVLFKEDSCQMHDPGYRVPATIRISARIMK